MTFPIIIAGDLYKLILKNALFQSKCSDFCASGPVTGTAEFLTRLTKT